MKGAPGSDARAQRERGPRIGVVGGGSMGACLIRGWIGSGLGVEVTVSEPDGARRAALSEIAGLTVTADNRGAADADVVILAVRSEVVEPVLAEIGEVLRATGACTVCLAASIAYEDLRAQVGEGVPLVAAMPNTPTQHRLGATGLYEDGSLPAADRERVTDLFSALGLVHWLDDPAGFSAFAAIAGCGPAYYFLWSKLLVEAAVALGLDPATARRLVDAVAVGAAQTMVSAEAPDHEALLREVATPGGVTERALNTFEEGALGQLVLRAIRVAELSARPTPPAARGPAEP